MIINCDNCCGQNKNNLMMDYMLWRINNGLHTSITVSFLLAGHTKFAPDGCFGLFKREFRRTYVSCLDDIVKTVCNSTQEGINKACLVGSESGEQYVHYYDWESFLKPHFKRLVGIKSFHHFTFSSEHHDSVSVKEFSDSPSIKIKLLRGDCPDGFPEKIPIEGLDDARRSYLHKEVREFCTPETRDLVCPAP
ncbi:uncharacterized protein LOC117114589 [Anneissia japonica]|uniref:uncharacterized protein LOC117114589 n=1 Tax=Anneissia japonica TaxID=1529436 RepID=UPI00142574A5|nr:uncharacterized protein LOC117114589 [Anneissia japonica]